MHGVERLGLAAARPRDGEPCRAERSRVPLYSERRRLVVGFVSCGIAGNQCQSSSWALSCPNTARLSIRIGIRCSALYNAWKASIPDPWKRATSLPGPRISKSTSHPCSSLSSGCHSRTRIVSSVRPGRLSVSSRSAIGGCMRRWCHCPRHRQASVLCIQRDTSGCRPSGRCCIYLERFLEFSPSNTDPIVHRALRNPPRRFQTGRLRGPFHDLHCARHGTVISREGVPTERAAEASRPGEYAQLSD